MAPPSARLLYAKLLRIGRIGQPLPISTRRHGSLDGDYPAAHSGAPTGILSQFGAGIHGRLWKIDTASSVSKHTDCKPACLPGLIEKVDRILMVETFPHVLEGRLENLLGSAVQGRRTRRRSRQTAWQCSSARYWLQRSCVVCARYRASMAGITAHVRRARPKAESTPGLILISRRPEPPRQKPNRRA